MKFKGKPIDIEPYEDGTWPSWFEEILEEDGYVHGYYVDGYIVGDVVDATDEWINLSFWCPVDKDSVEVVGMKIIIAIINLITMVLNGFVLSFGWNTFVLRIFELPRISAWTALALVLMYELVVYKSINVRWNEYLNKEIADDETERAVKLTVSGLVFILLVYLILFLLSLI